MGTAKLNIVIDLEALRRLKLSLNEYAVAEYISRLQLDPDNGLSGWCIVSKKEIAKALRLSEQSVFNILKKLLTKGIIERLLNDAINSNLDRQTRILRKLTHLKSYL